MAAILTIIAAALFNPATATVPPANADVQVASAAAPVVEIPFNPPLGSELRYRFTRERTGQARREEATFAISFRRVGDDYVMASRVVLPAGLPPPPATSGLEPVLVQPTEFRVSADGEIIEMLNADRIWEDSERAIEELLRAQPLGDHGRNQLRQIIADIRALPPEAQLELFTRQIGVILDGAGGEFPLGEEQSVSGEVRSVAGVATQEGRVRLEGVTDGVARLSATSSVSNEEAQAAVQSFLARLTRPESSAPSFRILANETRETYEISMETGLLLRHRSERTIDANVGGTRQTLRDVQTMESIATH